MIPFKLFNDLGQLRGDELERMVRELATSSQDAFVGGSFFQSSAGTVYTPDVAAAANTVAIKHNGFLVGTRPTINLIDSTVTWTTTDNPGSNSVDATAAAAGGGTTITVNSIDPGTGDSVISITNVAIVEVDLATGLALVNDAGKANIKAQNASATHAGVVSTGAQTFAGDKTFAGIGYFNTQYTHFNFSGDEVRLGGATYGGSTKVGELSLLQGGGARLTLFLDWSNAKCVFEEINVGGAHVDIALVLVNAAGVSQVGVTGTMADQSTTYGGIVTRIKGGTPPSVTGSRGGNAALASLLTTLATTNLIVDNTTV